MSCPSNPSRQISAFAPASIGNVGPGYDVLGLALSDLGDTVHARLTDTPGVSIKEITGDGGKLPREAAKNTAGIAAIETLKLAEASDHGVELTLHKGLPIGSGLGSSAASAVAAAVATNALLGAPLRKVQLVGPCLEAEAQVSGPCPDNVSASLLGGLVLVHGVDPLEVIRVPTPERLHVVVATPQFSLETRAARAALPQEVPLGQMVQNVAHIGAMISACYSGDLQLLARCICDPVVNPPRLALIPGASQVIEAALDAGAVGASISGAGPSIFAFARSHYSGATIGQAMVQAFHHAGLQANAHLSPVDSPGARLI